MSALRKTWNIICAGAGWYWRRVKEIPFAVCWFAAGGIWTSLLMIVPEAAAKVLKAALQ